MSDFAVPPLGKDEIPDLYVDNIPLACQGLLPRNDYAQYINGARKLGPLDALWADVGHLFALRRLTFTTSDNTPRLVRALGGNPLMVFYETEKLLEAPCARPRGRWPADLAFAAGIPPYSSISSQQRRRFHG